MKEALKLALEALEDRSSLMKWQEARDAVKEALAQPEQTQPDKVCIEDDGCPTEKAVLQRFWREHQKTQPEQIPPSAYSNTHQPKQEPVAWLHRQGNFTEACMNRLHDDEIDRGWTEEPLYTTPPQRTWVGLTDKEYTKLWGKKPDLLNFFRQIEAKLKEKNT